MSVDFTTKNKQSLNFQYKDQNDISLSSTIGGESVDITIGQPQVFDASKTTVTDALVLEDIVADANLRYAADEAPIAPGKLGRPHFNGETSRYWRNLGSDEGMDLIQPWSYPTKPGAPADEIHCPVFDNDDANNPFSSGAFKFSIDQTSTDYIDELVFEDEADDVREEIRYIRSHKYFYFGSYKEDYDGVLGMASDVPSNNSNFKTFSTGSGPYTMYAVYSKSGSGTNDYYSPLWTPILGYGEDADTSNPISIGGEVLQTYDSAFFHDPVESANTYSFSLFDGSRPKTAGDSVVAATSHSFNRFQYTTAPRAFNGDVQIYVFTYTGTTDDKFSFFDIDSRGVVNEKKGVGSVDGVGGGTSCNVFGAPERMAYRFKVGDALVSNYDPDDNGSSIYVAEFGYFDKALEGKTAATLCRLLREKYKVA